MIYELEIDGTVLKQHLATKMKYWDSYKGPDKQAKMEASFKESFRQSLERHFQVREKAVAMKNSLNLQCSEPFQYALKFEKVICEAYQIDLIAEDHAIDAYYQYIDALKETE